MKGSGNLQVSVIGWFFRLAGNYILVTSDELLTVQGVINTEYGQAMEAYSGEERQEKALPGSSKL